MLIDAYNLPNGHTIESDVCVVGAGPAGITLAKQLAGQQVRVLLLESGGLEAETAPQNLGQGSSEGDPYVPLESTRTRQFGGTANQWHIDIGDGRIGVRHMPLDEVDFEKRDWLPYSCGWPFSKGYLKSYYERAQLICRAGTYAYNADSWERKKAVRLSFPEEKLVTSMFQFGPRDAFTQHHRDKLISSAHAVVCVHATVTEIETAADARSVVSLRVATLRQNSFRIKARVFVLASGGIENARLLLLSDKAQPGGLGNGNDLVGRFFMDHPLVHGGVIVPRNREIFQRLALYDMRWVNDSVVMGKLSLNEKLLRQERLLNVSTILFPKRRPSLFYLAWTERQTKALESAKYLFSFARRFQLPPDALMKSIGLAGNLDALAVYAYRKVRNTISKHSADTPNLMWGGWSEMTNHWNQFDNIEVVHQTEQAPHRDNRIVLSDKKDALGQRKAHLVWQWRPEDIDAVKRVQEAVRESFEAANIGTFNIARDGDKPVLLSPSTHHHMGTTRMYPNPQQGVVDADCRVHGIDNLFVAGSSVFPSGGYANPTLTIVALSIRLADHIEARLQTADEVNKTDAAMQ